MLSSKVNIRTLAIARILLIPVVLTPLLAFGLSLTNGEVYINNSQIGTYSGGASYFNLTTNGAVVTSFTNNGAIYQNVSGGNVLYINGSSTTAITQLVNDGLMYAYGSRDVIDNHSSQISLFTNIGSLVGNVGINNASNGSIGTLNNLQGAGSTYYAPIAINNSTLANTPTASGPLIYTNGTLPNYYNIIINGTSNYGQLAVINYNGTMAFGIYGGAVGFTPITYTNSSGGNSTIAASIVTAHTYTDVLQGFTDLSHVTGTTGTYDGYNYQLVADSVISGDWNLVFTLPGPSAADTQASLAQSAQALRGVYDLQNVSINNNLNNDCTLFDVHDICTSVTGAQNYLSGGVNNDTTSGTLTVAYRLNDNVRIGGYLDQNLNTSNVTGVHLNNGSPAFGAFAVWNANADGLGTQLRVSAGYADKDMTVTRQVIGTSEAGSGTTSLKSYGASLVGSYAMGMPGNFTFSPYAGLRYTKVTANGYTEASSDTVTAPLTYSALTQNATTAIVGARWTKPILEHAVAYASLGLEQDLNNNGGTYTATGVDGLTPIAFNANINRTRPTASIGSYYNLGDRQRIAANLVWSEEAFTTNNATSLMVTYTAGF